MLLLLTVLELLVLTSTTMQSRRHLISASLIPSNSACLPAKSSYELFHQKSLAQHTRARFNFSLSRVAIPSFERHLQKEWR